MEKKATNKLNLHKVLENTTYTHALISTYTFDPFFFEEYCLQKFKSLHSNSNITVFTDRLIYETAISAPEQYRTKQANLRYLLHPVSVPGIFHPKVFLFANKNRGMLIIGSANFTRPGITSNAELVGIYDYSENNQTSLRLFQSAYQFFTEIQSRFPSPTLNSNLRAMAREAPWLISTESDTTDEEIILLNNFDFTILEQLISLTSSNVNSIWILSRFFDAKPDILDKIADTLCPKKIKIFTQNGTTTLSECWLKHPSVKKGDTEIYLTEYMDEDQYQHLHAKAVYIDADKKSLFGYGSANFTIPALIKTIKNGNLESFIVLPKCRLNKKQITTIFDPDGTSVKLISEEQLISVSPEWPKTQKKPQINLKEAALIEKKIRLTAEIENDLIKKLCFLKLQFRRDAIQMLTLKQDDNDSYHSDISQNIIQRLNQASTLAQVVVYDGKKEIAQSNIVLVVNLMDISTGKSIRKERHIKEAQETISQFFQVLIDLNSGEDDDALLTFLNYCDIPLINAETPRIFKSGRLVWDGGTGMRKIGTRQLKIFLSLHEAAISFFDRHYKKLNKHIEYGGLGGIDNYMHIWHAMGGILRSQVERAMQGFEAKSDPMSPDEWFSYRQKLETYFAKFETLMDCLWFEYMAPFLKKYKLVDIMQRFEPEMNSIEELCDDMINFRRRLEKIRMTTLKVRTTANQIIKPKYFNCILDEHHWPVYSGKVKLTFHDLKQSLTPPSQTSQ